MRPAAGTARSALEPRTVEMASAHPPKGSIDRTVRAVDSNMPARVAFWLGLLAIPLGPLFGLPAIILGVIGLNRQKTSPSPAGTRNAWIGIILGLITMILWMWIGWALIYAGDDAWY